MLQKCGFCSSNPPLPLKKNFYDSCSPSQKHMKSILTYYSQPIRPHSKKSTPCVTTQEDNLKKICGKFSMTRNRIQVVSFSFFYLFLLTIKNSGFDHLHYTIILCELTIDYIAINNGAWITYNLTTHTCLGSRICRYNKLYQLLC